MTGRLAPAGACLAAVALAAVGVTQGTWAVGGSDSACYGLMARAFAVGAWQPTSELAQEAPWPDPTATLAPAGFLPSADAPGAASPVCAPGFALLAAPGVAAIGPDGLFWVSPVAGALLVVLAFVLGRRLAGDLAGALASVLVATSPIVLYQVVQPMNDVTAAACWLAAVAAMVAMRRPSHGAAGVATGLALLLRPNLLPAGLALGAAIWYVHGRRDAVRFGTAVLPFGLTVLVLNHVLYGSALRSGYGDASVLFAVANIPLNVARHGRAILETQSGLPFLAPMALLVLWTDGRRAAGWLLFVAVTIVLGYLPYTSFPEWWYLRFLLPAVVLATVLGAAVIVSLLESRMRARAAAVAVMVVALAGAVMQWRTAAERQAFALRGLEARFRLVGETMRDRLPARAVAVAVWDSGSIRFHGEREALVWDALDPGWLDRAVAWLDSNDRPPVIVVERWEEPVFRTRFAGQVYGALDWPPRFDIDGRVRIFAPADRDRYLAGDPVPTETIWAR